MRGTSQAPIYGSKQRTKQFEATFSETVSKFPQAFMYVCKNRLSPYEERSPYYLLRDARKYGTRLHNSPGAAPSWFAHLQFYQKFFFKWRLPAVQWKLAAKKPSAEVNLRINFNLWLEDFWCRSIWFLLRAGKVTMTFKGSSVWLKSRPLWLAELDWLSSTPTFSPKTMKA